MLLLSCEKYSLKKQKKKKYKKEAFRSFTVKKNDGEIVKYATVFVSEKRQRILKVITEGKVSLYTLKANFFYGNDRTDINQSDLYADYDNFYIKRADEKVASNEFFANVFKNFKKTAKKYFSDCSELVTKIDASDFEKDLIKIVDYYNSNFK